VLVAGRRLWSHRAPAVSLVPWMWIVMLPALYVARGVQPVSRYLLVIVPVIDWLAWYAAEAWWRSDGRPSAMRRVAVLGAIVAATALAQNFTVYRSLVVPQVRSFTRGLEQSLIPWGRWFAAHTPEHASIATPDIGAIGYFSERRIVDLSGLISPQMLAVLHEEEMEDAVARFRFASFARPDYLVDRESRAWDLRRRSPYSRVLVPIGTATVPNLGIARPDSVVYSIYRIDWDAYDRLGSRPR
jgi:hypothetical protein